MHEMTELSGTQERGDMVTIQNHTMDCVPWVASTHGTQAHNGLIVYVTMSPSIPLTTKQPRPFVAQVFLWLVFISASCLCLCERVCGSVCSIQPIILRHIVWYSQRDSRFCPPHSSVAQLSLGSSRKTEEFHHAQLDVAFRQRTDH